MTRVIHRSGVALRLLSVGVLLSVGCGSESGPQGLSVDVTFAAGVPRAGAESIRVEVYLLDSCDSIATGDRPEDAIGSTFVLRDGTAGPVIGIPDSGAYGLYAIGQDANCAVVGANCRPVTIDAENPEALAIELAGFSGEGCFANQQCSIETGDCSGPSGDCVDLDSDGLGDGTRDNVGCVNATTDSNDADGTVCADTDGDSCDDCSSGSFDPLGDGVDSDADGICDAGDVCVDADGDGLGDGSGGNVGCADTTTDSNDGEATVCADTDGDSCDDCSNGSFAPLDDGVDSDGDGICDAGDVCVDADGDGLGDGTLGNAGCDDTTTDSNDTDETVCADTDGDGCDDCAIDTFDPSNDGVDSDGDGTCAVTDCDDDKPLCASVCTDVDDDGYCIDTDCDDAVASCDLDCTTNMDSDAHIDCFELFCGTNPMDGSSECLVAGSDAELKTAIDTADATAGHDYIVLTDFTMIVGAPSFDDDAGATIRQVAGAALTVDSGGDRQAFTFKSSNNVLDGVRIVNVRNARDVIVIESDDNVVQGCTLEGFERRGIFVNGGSSIEIVRNVISGGTDAPSDEVGAIVLKDSTGSVIADNTVVQNAMDGIQVRKAIGPFVDHNTVADNGGSGIVFYGDPSSAVCVRNNNVTGNAGNALNADKVVAFDTSASCTGPLSAGPAYGNNDFDNDGGSCGGNECLACACLPAGSFWEYSVDPQYSSTTMGDRDLYCVDPASSLVDGADDLGDYDLNGDAPGSFNGSLPDIGSREDGPGDCN